MNSNIVTEYIESQIEKEARAMRAAVTKEQMLAAITQCKDEAWKVATTLEDKRRSDALWDAIAAAVLRDCERREAEQREIERMGRAA